MINKEYLITRIMAQLSPEGEDVSGIKRFQVALALPNIVNRMVMEIASGTFPLAPLSNGVSGNRTDNSHLKELLIKTFDVDITAGDGIIADVIDVEGDSLLLQYPFISVKHSTIDSKQSVYVADEDSLPIMAEYYDDSAIVYAIAEGKIKLFPALTGTLKVTGYRVPEIASLELVFEPYIIDYAVSYFMGGKKK